MRAWARAGVAFGVCLLLAGCSGKTDEESMDAANGKAAQPKMSQLPGSAPIDPAAPLGAGGVDAALAAVQAYNERAAKELTDIDAHEAKIRAAATRAMEAAKGADSAPVAQRQALTQRVAAARKDADTARAALVDGQSRLRKDTEEQITNVEAMMETCNNDEKLSVYENCTQLTAEHDLLLKNIDALTARYRASDVAYGAEKAKLEEASAAVALAALR